MPPTSEPGPYHLDEMAAYRALADRQHVKAFRHAVAARNAYRAEGNDERAGRMDRIVRLLAEPEPENADGRRDVTPAAA